MCTNAVHARLLLGRDRGCGLGARHLDGAVARGDQVVAEADRAELAAPDGTTEPASIANVLPASGPSMTWSSNEVLAGGRERRVLRAVPSDQSDAMARRDARAMPGSAPRRRPDFLEKSRILKPLAQRIGSIRSRIESILSTISTMNDLRAIQRALETGPPPLAVFETVATAARDSTSFGARAFAGGLLGSIAGRAYDASWELAESGVRPPRRGARRRHTVGARRAPRGDRTRLQERVAHAARAQPALRRGRPRRRGRHLRRWRALAFPALEETVTSTFLDAAAPKRLRLAAIAALGRMGAESAAERIAAFVEPGARVRPRCRR